jgi:hypothetical protein
MVEPQHMRWYNPDLEVFEWREVPKSDEDALSLLGGSPYARRAARIPTCTGAS